MSSRAVPSRPSTKSIIPSTTRTSWPDRHLIALPFFEIGSPHLGHMQSESSNGPALAFRSMRTRLENAANNVINTPCTNDPRVQINDSDLTRLHGILSSLPSCKTRGRQHIAV